MKLIIEKLEDIIEWRKINCPEDIDIEDVILSVSEVKTIIRMYEQTERIQELVEWLNQECPEGTEGTFDLSHDFTQKLRVRIERIAQPNP